MLWSTDSSSAGLHKAQAPALGNGGVWEEFLASNKTFSF